MNEGRCDHDHNTFDEAVMTKYDFSMGCKTQETFGEKRIKAPSEVNVIIVAT